MATNYRENNMLINDPVPRNVSKFPIHQTYLTADAERTGNGGYKFKAPEVWSSARSGKKSIAIRSIEPIKKRRQIQFSIKVAQAPAYSTVYSFDYSTVAGVDSTVIDVIGDITSKFNAWADDKNYDFRLDAVYQDNTLTFIMLDTDFQPTVDYSILITAYQATADEYGIYLPSESFNEFFNQPKNFMNEGDTTLVFNNVWDHSSTLYFHASFIPFDNYQYLGELHDTWQTPIIYQDPNTSPLFNIWITSDLKTPFPILHEHFIFRFTFILSSESQYHS